jgi:hypothetical protein
MFLGHVELVLEEPAGASKIIQISKDLKIGDNIEDA